MPTPIKMPQFGESVVEGTVSQWLKRPGDSVEKMEPLLEVSTDKIDTEIPSPIGGTLLEIRADAGQTVSAGTIIGYIGSPGERVPTVGAEDHEKVQQVVSEPVEPVQARPFPAADRSSMSRDKSDQRPSGRDFVSPVVARMVAEHDIDLNQVAGSGLGGRVTKKDLLAYLEQLDRKRSQDDRSVATSNEIRVKGVKTLPVAVATGSLKLAENEALHPITGMRRSIAQHMVQSKHTSPHVSTIFEVDMTQVVRHREMHKASAARRGVKLNYTAYFVAASAAALAAEPAVNSRFTDEGIVTNSRIHIGVAVALPDSPNSFLDGGLVVPVIRDADEKNLQGIARAVQELSHAARHHQLTVDDVQGGTFTVSNHGTGGSLIGTPIINQPQAGILGVGAIAKRPVVRSTHGTLMPHADDSIVIRPMCYLSFTFDHRVLDGAIADRFVTRIKHFLESFAE